VDLPIHQLLGTEGVSRNEKGFHLKGVETRQTSAREAYHRGQQRGIRGRKSQGRKLNDGKKEFYSQTRSMSAVHEGD